MAGQRLWPRARPCNHNSGGTEQMWRNRVQPPWLLQHMSILSVLYASPMSLQSASLCRATVVRVRGRGWQTPAMPLSCRVSGSMSGDASGVVCVEKSGRCRLLGCCRTSRRERSGPHSDGMRAELGRLGLILPLRLRLCRGCSCSNIVVAKAEIFERVGSHKVAVAVHSVSERVLGYFGHG